MKLALTLPAYILAAASLAALGRPSESAAGPTFRFELADGAIVTGSIKAERVVVRTPYGQFELDPSAVRKIEQLSPSLDAYLIHGAVDGERTDFVDGVPESLAKTLQRITRVANTYGGMATAKATAPCLYPVEGKGEIPRVLVEGDKTLYPIKGSWAARLQSGWHYYDENHVLLNKTVAEVLPHYESKVDYYIVPAGSGLGAPVERPKEATLVLVLELRDGTRLRGKTKLDAFAVSCPYGKLNVPLAEIRGIVVEQLSTKGETWQQVKLEMYNGDRLTGRPKTTKLDVETAYGRLSVPLADVAKIEVSALQPDAALPAGLVLHYAFDEKNDKVADKSGRDNHGTVRGATWTEKGKVGGAFQFGGRDDRIESGKNTGVEGASPRTLAAWIRCDDIPAGKSMVPVGFGESNSYGNPSCSGTMFAIAVHCVGGTKTIGMWGVNDGDVWSPTPLPTGRWLHVAATYDGNTVRLYLDGKLDVCKKVSLATPASRLFLARVWGDYPDRAPFQGAVDEVMLYNRALSAEEVRRIYEQDMRPSERIP